MAENTLTRKDIVAAVKESQADLSKTQIESVVTDTLDTLAAALTEGKKINLHGFGSFSTSERAARTGRNPQTGAEVQIAASTAVKFTASQALKNQVNKNA